MRSNQNPGPGSKGEPETKSMGSKALAVNEDLTLLPLKFNWDKHWDMQARQMRGRRTDGQKGDRQVDHTADSRGGGAETGRATTCSRVPAFCARSPSEHSVRVVVSVCRTLGAGPCPVPGQAPGHRFTPGSILSRL